MCGFRAARALAAYSPEGYQLVWCVEERLAEPKGLEGLQVFPAAALVS